MLHHLEVIGEACRGLSEQFRRSHTEGIWSDAIGFRNILAHQYFGIDYEAAWAVVEHDLPRLKEKASEILESA